MVLAGELNILCPLINLLY